LFLPTLRTSFWVALTVVSIFGGAFLFCLSACHAEDTGSIPGCGVLSFKPCCACDAVILIVIIVIVIIVATQGGAAC
jgi:hypothetical protein